MPENLTQLDSQKMDQLTDPVGHAIALAEDPNEVDLSALAPFELTELPRSKKLNASDEWPNGAEVKIRIELGRTSLGLEHVAAFDQGAIVELDRMVGDPVDVYANGRLFARGEILVLNDDFCVRVTELLSDWAVM